MRRAIWMSLPVLLALNSAAMAVGLTPNATRMDLIKYVAILIFGLLVMFFLIIRMTIVPFLVKNYYTLSDATNIGLSLFILYGLNLFTLLFFRYSLSVGWRLLFLFIALMWLIHLVVKVLLSKRGE